MPQFLDVIDLILICFGVSAFAYIIRRILLILPKLFIKMFVMKGWSDK